MKERSAIAALAIEDFPFSEWLQPPPLIENPTDGSLMVLVPGGAFRAGEDGSSNVDLPAFYLGIHPVTNLQFFQFAKSAGCSKTGVGWHKGKYPKRQESHPIMISDFEDAEAYCVWAGLRLPRELEWEKAARALDGRKYPWGNDQRMGNGREVFPKSTSPGWQDPLGCSPWGLYGMCGNIREWCGAWDRQQPLASFKGGGLHAGQTGQHHARSRDWIIHAMVTGKLIIGALTPESLSGFAFRVARNLASQNTLDTLHSTLNLPPPTHNRT